jgi:hypothetical protein
MPYSLFSHLPQPLYKYLPPLAHALVGSLSLPVGSPGVGQFHQQTQDGPPQAAADTARKSSNRRKRQTPLRKVS